jgi:hypothetical protein
MPQVIFDDDLETLMSSNPELISDIISFALKAGIICSSPLSIDDFKELVNLLSAKK